MFKIIADSCCDYKNEKGLFYDVKRIPLHITIGNRIYIDNKDLDINNLLLDIDNSKTTPKSRCPSPDDYLEAIKGEADEIFIVTLSNKLSGSYNSALLAANLYLEEHDDKKIHVFDTLSGTAGELVVVNQIQELINKNKSFTSIIEKVEYLIKNENKLYTVLENLDTLIKNGRLTKLQATLTSIAKIKLILSTTDGEIGLHSKALSSAQARSKVLKEIINSGKDFSEKTMFITHCDALDIANDFKRKVLLKTNFKNVEIFEASGLSCVYANRGGIIIAY